MSSVSTAEYLSFDEIAELFGIKQNILRRILINHKLHGDNLPTRKAFDKGYCVFLPKETGGLDEWRWNKNKIVEFMIPAMARLGFKKALDLDPQAEGYPQRGFSTVNPFKVGSYIKIPAGQPYTKDTAELLDEERVADILSVEVSATWGNDQELSECPGNNGSWVGFEDENGVLLKIVVNANLCHFNKEDAYLKGW